MCSMFASRVVVPSDLSRGIAKKVGVCGIRVLGCKVWLSERMPLKREKKRPRGKA